jgi:hypothetical protein
MAPRLPTGYGDDFTTPLTQEEALFLNAVMVWAVTRNKRVDPEYWLDLPDVTGTREEYESLLLDEPKRDNYLPTIAPDYNTYNKYYKRNEATILKKVAEGGGLTDTEAAALIASYIEEGGEDIAFEEIEKYPELFTPVANSNFETLDSYLLFASKLNDQKISVDLKYNADKKEFDNKIKKFVYDPYDSAGYRIPKVEATYDSGAVFPKIGDVSGGFRSLGIGPREDAIQLAVAKEIYNQYGPEIRGVPEGVANALAPTTRGPNLSSIPSTPVVTTAPAVTSTVVPTDRVVRTVPMTPQMLEVGRQRAQLAKDYAQLGMSSNFGLGVPGDSGIPAGISGPSRPVVSGMPPQRIIPDRIDNKTRALLDIISRGR